MSRRKLERQINLTMALMATSRPLSVAQIARVVPGYARSDEDTDGPDVADEAFRRMFERDKEELREQGIPLVTEPLSVWDDSEVGYRIRRQDYQLPDLHLDPDEAAALGLAARLWESASLAAGVSSALRKLQAAGAEVHPVELGVAARVDATDPAFEPLLAAVRARQAVTFDYRGPRDAGPRTRVVEPWGVLSWHGRWYVVGLDRDRAAERVFRLSRIVGDVVGTGPVGAVSAPAGLDLTARVAATQARATPGTARVRVAAGTGWVLRRQATAVEQAPEGDLLTVDFPDLERFAEQVVGLGPDAVALAPPELRTAVRRRLLAVLA